MRINAEVLGQVSENSAHDFRRADNVVALQENTSLGGFCDRGKDAHQRRLPRTIRPEQPQNAGSHFQTEVTQSPSFGAVVFTEVFYDQLHFESHWPGDLLPGENEMPS